MKRYTKRIIMTKTITISDVAREAGLSIGAISKVINGHSVRPKTRQQVEAAIKKTGYTPNAFARGIRSVDKGNIGIVTTPFQRSDWVEDIVFKIISCSMDRKVNFLVEAMEKNPSSAPRLLPLVDGLILLGHFEDDFFQALTRAGAPPVVSFGEIPENYKNISTLCIDNVKSGKDLTNHMILQGHRNIAFVSDSSISGNQRKEGYKEAVIECYGAVSENLIFEHEGKEFNHLKAGYELTMQILQSEVSPTAIIYATESMANGGILAAYKQNLSLPEDLSVVAFSGVKDSIDTMPALTSMVYDNEQISNKLLDLFFEVYKLKRVGNKNIIDSFYLNKQESVRNMNI